MPEPSEALVTRIARFASRDVPGFGRVGPGPVLSVVRDTATGKIYVGLNTGAPAETVDVLQKSISAEATRISNGEVIVVRTDPLAANGGNAEVSGVQRG